MWSQIDTIETFVTHWLFPRPALTSCDYLQVSFFKEDHMEIPLLEKFKQVWQKWDLRFLMLVSLLLQTTLIAFAFLRKRTGNKVVILLIWVAYLLADWVAAVAVGLISSSKGSPCDAPDENKDLLPFWAAFLLLHLGGPDSITSFSLEDNELWLRHLLGLILQVVAAAYLFFESLPNKLWIPTTLIFIAGTIKYAERTCALYMASSDRFGGSVLPEPDPGSEYEKVAQRFSAMKKGNLPIRVEIVPEPKRRLWGSNYSASESVIMDEKLLLQNAYGIFDTFKGLIVGHIFSSREREVSRDFFLKRNAQDAFKLIEFELSFMYEVLHTKLTVTRCRLGYLFRVISFTSELVAFLFFTLMKEHEYRKIDDTVTYLLLIAAIILDVVSFIRLIFSDWTVISLKNRWGELVAAFVMKRKRWSGSVSQGNFIHYCLSYRSIRLEHFLVSLGIGDYVDNLVMAMSLSSKKIEDYVQEFIFEELKEKSRGAEDVKTGEMLCSQGRAGTFLNDSGHGEMSWSIEHFQYAESLLLWHIASSLCYYSDNESDEDVIDRKLCKLLSDYIFYLLVMKPTMLAPVAGNWQFVFQDSCAEAKRFFRKSDVLHDLTACKKLLSVNTIGRSTAVKGGKSKSVLFDACILAKQLLELEQSRWKLMCKVWVELMSYAAINCRPTVHADQPSRGGELLTFIWLMMTHLGLGKQYHEQVSLGKMKMIVGK
ncbi:hypothetical protein RJ639_036569 [Escallonia herrerae]|uniref:DUF4220 domain-containing protein n=1 Tax=Escallonia herrerae TaxID=1293975 RepID=A0AA89B7E5_9ASTE|nr:hypothetical protein RJ639_036569 [Escallonia herrerae]